MFSLQSAVRDLDAKQTEAAPSFGTGLRLDFMRGMARAGAGFMTLLDVTRVLSVNDMAAMVTCSPQERGPWSRGGGGFTSTLSEEQSSRFPSALAWQ